MIVKAVVKFIDKVKNIFPSATARMAKQNKNSLLFVGKQIGKQAKAALANLENKDKPKMKPKKNR